MKYYKFVNELDWDSLLAEVEEATEQESSADRLETEMHELIETTQPIDVDEVDESVDGLYIDIDEPDKSLGGEYVFAEVVYGRETVYEFEVELEVLKDLIDKQ